MKRATGKRDIRSERSPVATHDGCLSSRINFLNYADTPAVAVVLQSMVRVLVTWRADRGQIDCKTKFDVRPHTVQVISVNTDFLWRPSQEKDYISLQSEKEGTS